MADSERSGARRRARAVPGSSGERGERVRVAGRGGEEGVRVAFPAVCCSTGRGWGLSSASPGRDGCGAGLTCLSLKM